MYIPIYDINTSDIYLSLVNFANKIGKWAKLYITMTMPKRLNVKEKSKTTK